MTRSAAFAVLVGLALAVTLYATNDFGGVTRALAGAGWGILLVVACHVPQTFTSALGWGPLIEPAPASSSLFLLRWVRESVNALLPVAQVGGDVVRVRLVVQRGVGLANAAAATVVDVSVEMIAQVVFTLAGVALLLAGPHPEAARSLGIGVAIASAVLVVAFVAAQRLGLFALVERLMRRSVEGRWAFVGDLAGMHEQIMHLYRQPRRIWTSGGYHLASWMLGVVETYAALHVLGVGAGWREAMIVESLGQAIRAAGFLIPGALGVQEGGYLLIGAAVGIAAPQALALSLIRRVRELTLGLPGLVLWHRMEARRPPRAVIESST